MKRCEGVAHLDSPKRPEENTTFAADYSSDIDLKAKPCYVTYLAVRRMTVPNKLGVKSASGVMVKRPDS